MMVSIIKNMSIQLFSSFIIFLVGNNKCYFRVSMYFINTDLNLVFSFTGI